MSQYKTFAEFYPFYLSQHMNTTCRRLHYFGTTIVIAWTTGCLVTAHYPLILVAFLFGYGPAWIGHFFFEKNRPATFKYPFYSFIADFVMYFQFLTGKLRLPAS